MAVKMLWVFLGEAIDYQMSDVYDGLRLRTCHSLRIVAGLVVLVQPFPTG
ncbi:hypothetical protein [Nostoc sp.]